MDNSFYMDSLHQDKSREDYATKPLHVCTHTLKKSNNSKSRSVSVDQSMDSIMGNNK